MATQIAPTPVLKGEAAKQFEEYINSPMTEEEKKIQERIRNKRDVHIFGIEE